MVTAIIYSTAVVVCVGMICFKGITIRHENQGTHLDESTLSKMKEMFETVNETDTEKDPTYKEVMEFIDEAFGGDDYGNEPTEATEE